MSWLRAARAWYRITTDTRGTISPAAAETADLALWTGRLAYADPGWTLALGPSRATRPPDSLAPEPGDLPDVVAAVHQACETLTGIAAADYSQIRTAADARRLLVPTRSLPDSFDIPQPFAPAPRDRVHVLLTAYHDAGAASAQATAAVATVAADIRAPSHILTVARAAIHADADPAGKGRRQPAEPATEPREFPGPVERILHDLGVTSPDVLLRASAIDQAGEQLILDAAQAFEPRYAGSETVGLSRSVATAELINHVLASASPSAAAILRPPPPPRTARPGVPDPDRNATSRRHVGLHDTWPTPEAEAEP